MTRRLLVLARVLSLVLAIALAALWVRSVWRFDSVAFASTRLAKAGWVGSAVKLSSLHGCVILDHWRLDFLPGHQPPEYYRGAIRGPAWASIPAGQRRVDLERQPLGWAGIGAVRLPGADSSSTYMLTTVCLPYWLLILAAALLPGSALVRRARSWYRQSFRPGVCRSCGYDLRASQERCPECGAPIRIEQRAIS